VLLLLLLLLLLLTMARAVLFVLHARQGSLGSIVPWCEHIADLAAVNAVGATRQLMIVAVEHRNHGQRTLDEAMNGGIERGERRHAHEM
jgi:hypothetical protein